MTRTSGVINITPVHRRVVAILLLVYQAAFLNAFVPAHTRGRITLDARSPDATHCATPRISAAAHCCPTRGAGDRSRDTAPSPADRANCAVCHLAATYTPPPAADLRPAALCLADLLPPHAPDSLTTAATPLPYHGRAPPAFA